MVMQFPTIFLIEGLWYDAQEEIGARKKSVDDACMTTNRDKNTKEWFLSTQGMRGAIETENGGKAKKAKTGGKSP